MEGRVGNEQAELRATLLAYPNPADNVLNVEFSVREDNTEALFEIYDVKGTREFVNSRTFAKGKHKTTLQLTDLSPKVYMLQVSTRTERIGIQKFVKQSN